MEEDAKELYGDENFANRLGGGEKPALLIVDFIKAFTDSNYDLGSVLDGPVNHTAELLELFRKESLPRFFTTIAYEESFGDAGVFVEKVPALKELRLGDRAVKVDDRISPEPNERVILKKYASAFFGTDLIAELVNNRVDTIVLTGCTTSGCIRASAVDGMQHGFRVLVPEECVGDRAERPHEANLFDIDAKYGDVTSLVTVKDYVSNLKENDQ